MTDLLALLFSGETSLSWLEERRGFGAVVQAFMISVPPGTNLSHKVRLKLQEGVMPVCMLGKSSDVTDDVVAGCMK